LDKPNIMLISIDQHNFESASYLGNPYLNTPSIDSLHRNGVSFVHSYSAGPACMPARSSWMTGLHSSEHMEPFNFSELPSDIPDLGQILRQNGYEAVHSGKWDVNGRDVRQSFHTLYYGNPEIGGGGAQFYDAATTHSACRFLSDYKGEKPFCLHVGIIDPHDICEYLHNFEYKELGNMAGLIGKALPPLPDNFDFEEGEIRLQKVCCRNTPMIHAPIRKIVDKWSESQWRLFIWHYYRFVEKADRWIGLLLEALASSPYCDNTLIIFTSDHGESLGSHQMFQKFTLYNESLHVQFIASSLGDGFGLKKGCIDHKQFVSGIDLLPTILDYCDIARPRNCTGVSLKPYLEGCIEPLRNYAYTEANYYGRAVIREDYKLITEYMPNADDRYKPVNALNNRLGACQLYNMKNDYNETADISHLPENLIIIEELLSNLRQIEQKLHQRPVQLQKTKAGVDKVTAAIWGEN